MPPRINLPTVTQEALNTLWSAAYGGGSSGAASNSSHPSANNNNNNNNNNNSYHTIDHKHLHESLNNAKAVLCEAETFLLHQPTSIPVVTMHQLALLNFITNQLSSKYANSDKTNSLSSYAQQQQQSSGSQTLVQLNATQQKQDSARDSINAMNTCRNYLGWVRSRASSKQQQQSTNQKSKKQSTSSSSSITTSLCLSAQVELYSANAHFQLRSYAASYECLLSARTFLVQLTKACFPQHNGNPSTYLMYFLTVSLCSIYHNLSVVAKQLQRYDAALMWILHFVRIAELIENEHSCPEVDELKEPLLTKARMARQFIVPVLYGMVSSETNQTPMELVIRVKAIAESGKHKIDAKDPKEYNTPNQNNKDDDDDDDEDDEQGEDSNNNRNSPKKKKDVRVMAARLAAVQSFGERYFAGAALQEILSGKYLVESNTTTTSSSSSHQQQHQQATESDNSNTKPASKGFFASLFGSSSSSSSTPQAKRKPNSSSSTTTTNSSSSRRPHHHHHQQNIRRINPLEVIKSIQPGDSKEEIQSKLHSLSFPFIKETTSSTTSSTSSSSNNNKETEILRKVLYYSKFGGGGLNNSNNMKSSSSTSTNITSSDSSLYDSILQTFSSSPINQQEQRQKFRQVCERVAAAVASELTNGKINTCDLTQLTPTDGSTEPMTQDQKEAQDLLFDVNTQLPGELRHLFFAGIDFASVGLEHTALVELAKFFLSERFDVICSAIEEDLNLLAVSLTSDSWGGGGGSLNNNNNNSTFSLLDFEAAMEVFCAEFDMLMTPLILVELDTTRGLDLYETGSVGCFSPAATEDNNNSPQEQQQLTLDNTTAHTSLSGSLQHTEGCPELNTILTAKNDDDDKQEQHGEKEDNNAERQQQQHKRSLSSSAIVTTKGGYIPELQGGSGLLSDPESRRKIHSKLPFYVQNYDWVCKFSSRKDGSSFSKLYDRCANCAPVLLVISARVANDDGIMTESLSPPSSQRASARTTRTSSPSMNDDHDNGNDNENDDDQNDKSEQQQQQQQQYTTFGAFISGPLEPRPPGIKKTVGLSSYGESFVFRELFLSSSSPQIEVYQYNPENSNPNSIVECSTERIQIGSSMNPAAVSNSEDNNNNGDDDGNGQQSKNNNNRGGCFASQGGPAIYLPAWLKAGSTYSCETFNNPPLMMNLSSSSSFVPAAVEVFGFGY